MERTDAGTVEQARFRNPGDLLVAEQSCAFQAGGEASFMTGHDEFILGINHKGKIQNFDPAGLTDAVDRLFGILDDPAKFDPKKFATEVKGFQQVFK